MNIIRFIKNLKKIIRAKPEIPLDLKNNKLLEKILSRRSIRKFTPQEIPQSHFSAILEAGRLAPSTVNLQSWYFITFTQKKWQAHFKSAMPFKAQRAVMIFGDARRTRKIIKTLSKTPLVDYTMAVMNTSLAAMNMNLAAEALGISSVMLSDSGKTGFFHPRYLKEKLSLPEGVYPLMTIVLGYGKKSNPPMPPKLPKDIVISDEPCYREAPMRLLKEWLEQMSTGYKASNPFSTFRKKLNYYQKNLEKAESELFEMVINRDFDE